MSFFKAMPFLALAAAPVQAAEYTVDALFEKLCSSEASFWRKNSAKFYDGKIITTVGRIDYNYRNRGSLYLDQTSYPSAPVRLTDFYDRSKSLYAAFDRKCDGECVAAVKLRVEKQNRFQVVGKQFIGEGHVVQCSALNWQDNYVFAVVTAEYVGDVSLVAVGDSDISSSVGAYLLDLGKSLAITVLK